jgi:hypothetical protein
VLHPYNYHGGLRCHLAARLGTAAADLRTLVHELVAKALAIGGATLAYFGTYPARTRVELRATDHKICAGLADLGTIEQQADMIRFGMLAAHLQAM